MCFKYGVFLCTLPLMWLQLAKATYPVVQLLAPLSNAHFLFPLGTVLLFLQLYYDTTCFCYPQSDLPQWWLMRAWSPGPPDRQLNIPSEGHDGNPSSQYLSQGWVYLAPFNCPNTDHTKDISGLKSTPETLRVKESIATLIYHPLWKSSWCQSISSTKGGKKWLRIHIEYLGIPLPCVVP